MKFVDVKNDVAFHKIFGNANKTITLISFLNAVMQLEGKERIVSVQIENPYLYPAAHGGKTVVIDIRATDEQGRHFIIEMQVADKEGFEKRTQFYTARDYAAQIDSGEKYAQLRPTHFIGILDFVLGENPYYFSQHQTIDTTTGECLLKDMQYFFIQLPKFNKTLSQLNTMMDRWIFFIKNAENMHFIPDDVTDEGLKTAYQTADRHNWSKAEMNTYFDTGAQFADQKQERIKARNEGIAEAEAKAEKEKIDMILTLDKNNVSVGVIAQAVNKIVTEVQKIIVDSKQ